MLCFDSSIGDWFLLYQMNKSMNQRFFAEFLALLSIKVHMLIHTISDYISQINPDPDLEDNPEIDIFKTEDSLGNGDIDGYCDEDELGNNRVDYSM